MYLFGIMVINMKEAFLTTKNKVMVFWLWLMVMFMKEVLLKINFVDKEFIFMKMDQNIQVNG